MESPTPGTAVMMLKVLRSADPPPPTRYFDPQALKEELIGIVTNDGGPDKARPHFVARVKEVIAAARAQARAELEADGLGTRCAAGLSLFQDDLIRMLFDLVVSYRCTPAERKEVEHMAILATGGYGRGMLAPGSDIDLLFLMPGSATDCETRASERLLYLLWDMGFKVGHATRNIAQCVQLSKADMTIATSMIDAPPHRRQREAFRRPSAPVPQERHQGQRPCLHRCQDG